MTKSVLLFLLTQVFGCVPLWAASKPVNVDELIIMTEEYPPYSFTTETGLRGFAVDIMVLMLEKVKSKRTRADIQVVPWSRGYKTTLSKPNTCLFAMAWTKDRSQAFKFVGPLEKFDSAALFAKKSRKISIKSYKDLVPYKIGVLRDDIAQAHLQEQGLRNLVELSSPDFLAKMLASDRIDLWGYGEESVPIIMKNMGINPSDFENVFRLHTGDSYYAFNRDTPAEIIQLFQNAYDELKKEKKIEAVMNSYLKKGGP